MGHFFENNKKGTFYLRLGPVSLPPFPQHQWSKYLLYLNPCAWSCVFTKIINSPRASDSCCPSHQVRWSLLLTWSKSHLDCSPLVSVPLTLPQHCKEFCSWKAHVHIWKAWCLHFLGQICALDTDSSWGSSNIIFHGLSLHFTQSSHTAIHCSQMTASAFQPSPAGSRCFLFLKSPCPHPKPHLSKSLFFHIPIGMETPHLAFFSESLVAFGFVFSDFPHIYSAHFKFLHACLPG